MSFNLYMNVGRDGPEIPLAQTPTAITFMCMSVDPKTFEPDGGHDGVRRRYVLWLKHFKMHKCSDDDVQWYKDHIATVEAVENPYFWWI